MKSLRYLLALLTIVLVLGLSLTACDDGANAQNSTNETKLETEQKSPDLNSLVKDSLNNFAARIDSISKESREAIDEVSSMNSKVSDLKNNEKWIWSSCGLGLLALILVLYCIIRSVKLNERLDRHRDKIQEFKRDKQNASFAPKSVFKSSTPADYERLKKRVSDLEFQIRQLTSYSQPIQPTQSKVEPIVTPAVLASNKNGYFGTPINATDPYFKKLLVSRDSDARFSAEISGVKAYFKPLDSSTYFGTFVSNDALRAAVEFKGCAPSEATSMQVIARGEAVQRDNKWVITKKATVNLS